MPRPRTNDVRHVPLRWVEDAGHYDVIADALGRAQVSLWIATANLKDMRLEAPIGSVARARRRYVSIAERFADLRGRGVELRVLHGGPPSRPFRESLARCSQLEPTHEWLRQCPRVHLKIIAVDGADLYLGSANLTGAGMGAKGAGRRNFEVGVNTTDHVLLDAAQRRFDAIWTGRECGACRVRANCPSPLDGDATPAARPVPPPEASQRPKVTKAGKVAQARKASAAGKASRAPKASAVRAPPAAQTVAARVAPRPRKKRPLRSASK